MTQMWCSWRRKTSSCHSGPSPPPTTRRAISHPLTKISRSDSPKTPPHPHGPVHGENPLGRLLFRAEGFCSFYLRHRESCTRLRTRLQDGLPVTMPRVPLCPSRCKRAGLAIFSTMMEAQRDGLVVHATAYNWSGPRSSPCCEHSALAERKHSMGTDIDATEHNICVTATDPAHTAPAAPLRNRQCTAHGFGFLGDILDSE